VSSDPGSHLSWLRRWPVGIPRSAGDDKQAGDAPPPAQGDQHEVGEAKHIGAVDGGHKKQAHLLP